MRRRAAAATVATGLVLLVMVAGGRWAVGRGNSDIAYGGRPPAPTTRPTIGGDVSAATPAPAVTAPSPSADSTPRRKRRLVGRALPAAERVPVVKPGSLRRTTGVRAVALTFDDGPHPVWTPKVLDRLRAARVRATFCLVGTEAQRYPSLVARIVREGHTLCNHSWHHEFDLGTWSEADIRANLERTNRAIRRGAPNAKIKYFRHPGGKWTPAAVKTANKLGMTALHWSVDPRDWTNPGASVITDRVLDRARPGAIVLLHDGGGDRGDTVAACPSILRTLTRTYGIQPLK